MGGKRGQKGPKLEKVCEGVQKNAKNVEKCKKMQKDLMKCKGMQRWFKGGRGVKGG